MSDDTETSRREFFRRGAIVGGTLLWATPVVQSIPTPAFAQGSPLSGGGEQDDDENEDKNKGDDKNKDKGEATHDHADATVEHPDHAPEATHDHQRVHRQRR